MGYFESAQHPTTVRQRFRQELRVGPSRTETTPQALDATQPPGSAGDSPIDATPIDDAVAALQAGVDREASFRLLFDTYQRPLRRFFLRKGFSPEEASDLTQETFVGILGALKGYRHENRFEGWLYRLATTTFLKRLRAAGAAKRRGREVSHNELGPRDLPPETPDSPLAEAIFDERRRTLRRAVGELPAQLRRCLTLRIYRELSHKEIATLMRLKPESVKAYLHQARSRLREALAEARSSGERTRGEPG